MVKIDKLEARGDVVLYDVGSACEYFHRTKVRKTWRCADCGVEIPSGSYAMVRHIEDIQIGHFCTSTRTHYCEECGEKRIEKELKDVEARRSAYEKCRKETPAEYKARKEAKGRSEWEIRTQEIDKLFDGEKIVLGVR